MKLVPRSNQILGRVVIKRVLSAIVRPDETRNTTKFVLIDAVGPDAEAKGLQVGYVVLPSAMSNIKLDGGAYFRPILSESDVIAVVADVTREEFLVQTDSGAEYVDIDDPRAATSLGADPAAPAPAAHAGVAQAGPFERGERVHAQRSASGRVQVGTVKGVSSDNVIASVAWDGDLRHGERPSVTGEKETAAAK